MTGTANTDEATRSVSVAMVDPSRMVPTYTAALTAHLHEVGVRATVFDRRRRGNEPTAGDSDAGRDHVAHFYSVSEWVRGRLGASAGRMVKPFEHLIDLARLARRVGAGRFDVVHLQWPVVPLLDGAFVRLVRRRIPVVMTVHDSLPLHGSRWSIEALGSTWCRNGADSLVVHVPHTAQVVGTGSVPIHQIAMGAPVAEPVPVEHGDEFVVLMFGRVREYKGVDLAITAIAELNPVLRARTVLRIVGQPLMDVGPLMRLVAELGVTENVEWTLGFVDDDEVDRVFRWADAVLLPYRDIDGSGVAHDALARGIPIVAAAVGGLRDLLVDGETALLVPPESPRLLAKALERVAADPDLCREMSARQRCSASRRSWYQTATHTAELYRSLIAAR